MFVSDRRRRTEMEGIMELISKMHAEGKTIIMVTHDKTLFSYADRIITI